MLSIFFLSMLPSFLSGNPATTPAEMALLGGVFVALTLAVFIAYGLCADAVRTRLFARAAVLRWLNRSFGAIFAALAARLAMERA
jgi:threonine/homoserine/homoserine lactone efflux protein